MDKTKINDLFHVKKSTFSARKKSFEEDDPEEAFKV